MIGGKEGGWGEGEPTSRPRNPEMSVSFLGLLKCASSPTCMGYPRISRDISNGCQFNFRLGWGNS